MTCVHCDNCCVLLQEYVKTFGKAEEHKTWPQWCGMVFLRLVINIAVVAALAGFGYLVWFVAPLADATKRDEQV